MKVKFYQKLLSLAPDAAAARFLLAVSGGCDSVALAHLFAHKGLAFDVAHCNFHLRGEESNNEMIFVQNLPFLTKQQVFVKEFDTMALQQKSGKSIEMLARELRYHWFEELGKNYDYVVTAHQANDNAETMLMNLIRGTGLRGMCGIPQKNGKIIRPLLRFQRSEIENYIIEQGLQFCLDSSNLSDCFLRNKVRNKIIPELEKINPKLIEIFSKNSELFLQQTKFFDKQIQQYKNKLWNETDDTITIAIDPLKNIENQSVVLYQMLNPLGFNACDVEDILKAMDANSGKQFLSETHLLIKDRDLFIIENKDKKEVEEVLVNSVDELEKFGIQVEKRKYHADFKPVKNSNMIYVDAEKLSFPLTIRSWKKGDYFYPFGMKTKKKVSNFFTDLKIDLFEKQKIRFLCSQNQIVWIINYRADDRFKINEHTKSYYIFKSLTL